MTKNQKADVPELLPDTKGYITISKGDVEAKIVPSALNAWERNGWSPVKQDIPDAVQVAFQEAVAEEEV